MRCSVVAVRNVEERALHVISSNIMEGESALMLFKISLLRELHLHEVNHPSASLVGSSPPPHFSDAPFIHRMTASRPFLKPGGKCEGRTAS